MAFKKNQFKATKMRKKSNFGKNAMFYGIVAVMLAVSFIGLQRETSKYKKEISLVSLKAEIGGKVVEVADLAPYKLPQKAVKEGMILWDDREEAVVGKYLTMQVRAETPLYEDMISQDSTIRYQYLYELAPNEELLTFSYNNMEAGGRIPRPGDRFRIRGSYKIPKEELERQRALMEQEATPTGKAGQDIKDKDGKVVIESSTDSQQLIGEIKTDIVFDVVTVVDMLNSKGDSIFEINKQLEALSAAAQEELMADDTFKTSLTPESLLLIVKSEQVQKYVEYNAGSDVKYTLTLLTRDKSLMEDDIRSGGSVLDVIPTAPTDGGGDSN